MGSRMEVCTHSRDANQDIYFFPLPLALNVFNGSTLPFLRTTLLPLPLLYCFLTFGMFRPTKPTSSGFFPPGRR